jgi:hypothetical protein
MNILVTDAFGNVGISTLDELIKACHKIRILEAKNRKIRSIQRNISIKQRLFGET